MSVFVNPLTGEVESECPCPANATPSTPGPPGPEGPEGPQGDMGPPGSPGSQGPKGDKGDTGATGAAGAAGPPGSDGADGEDSVVPGPQGAQGVPGSTGATGATGPPGTPGIDGLDGEDGAQGPPGVDGAIGPPGIQGIPGADGEDGMDSMVPGARGLTGSAGATGAQGAVGFGVDGIDGEDSLIPGPAGIGPQGATGAVGATGNLFLSSFDGEGNYEEEKNILGFSPAFVLPPGILNHTLRFNGQQWVDSGVLTNDATNIVDTGNFTAQGATHIFGNASGASDTNFTIGQGTTGFDACILTIRSANGLSSVRPQLKLNRNGTDFVTLSTDGTDSFFDYSGTANFRSSTVTKVSFSSAGNVTAVGGSHNLGTAGSLCSLTIGQGGTGTASSVLGINSGNTGSGAPQILLQRNAVNLAQFATDGTNTLLDYTGILQLHSGVGGTLVHAISAAGLISNYKAIATVSNGVPAEYATIDRTGLTAAVASTLLYAVPVAGAGMYRISWVATVTTVATTSTLGGTNGFQIDYTDNDTNVAKLTPQAGVPAAALDQAYSQTNQGNTTATVISGVIVVNAKASTNINYRIDYTSAPGATMAYNLHIKIEAL